MHRLVCLLPLPCIDAWLSPFPALSPSGTAPVISVWPEQLSTSPCLPATKVQHILKSGHAVKHAPISRHTRLEGTGLGGHRFQNLGGRDDPLFLEEGKNQVEYLSSFPSLSIMVSPSTGLGCWQKQHVTYMAVAKIHHRAVQPSLYHGNQLCLLQQPICSAPSVAQ